MIQKKNVTHEKERKNEERKENKYEEIYTDTMRERKKLLYLKRKQMN